jgi:hypothetical protein
VPDFCTDYCLARSGVESDCVTVQLADSSFNEERMGETRVHQEVEVTYEYIEENNEAASSCFTTKDFTCPEKCNAENDYDCCIESGKCWNKGCTSCDETQCQFSSDCPDTCDEGVVVRHMCNLETGSCDEFKRISCTEERFEGESFPGVCNEGVCEISLTALEARRAQLREESIDLNNGFMNIGAVRAKFESQCRAQVAVMLGEFVTEAAMLVKPYGKTVAKVLTEPAQKILDILLNVAAGGDPPALSQSEQLVWTCKQSTILTEQEAILDEEYAHIIEKIARYDEKIAELKA